MCSMGPFLNTGLLNKGLFFQENLPKKSGISNGTSLALHIVTVPNTSLNKVRDTTSNKAGL